MPGVVDSVLAALREHPIAAEAERQSIERRRAEREHHASEIERLRAEQEEQLAAAQRACDAAEVAARTARAGFEAAERRAREARSARYTLSVAGPRLRVIADHEGALLDLAEPAIDAFVREMRDLVAEDRNTIDVRSTVSRVSPAGFPGPAEFVESGNIASVAARVAAIADAIEAANAMRRRVDQSTVAAELDALRAGIPSVVDASVTFRGPVLPERSVRRDDDDGATVFAFGGR